MVMTNNHSLLAVYLYDNEGIQDTPLHSRKNGDMNEHNGAVLERRAAPSFHYRKPPAEMAPINAN
jgi:hypothetical protein